jgi:hypothetical protein
MNKRSFFLPEFHPKRDPPVSEIVCWYKGKEYVFKIASIEVREEDVNKNKYK